MAKKGAARLLNLLTTHTRANMAAPTLLEQQGLRIAIEGCGHGVLHEIYASVAKSCELKGWPDVDLLIIGGDFQVCAAERTF